MDAKAASRMLPLGAVLALALMVSVSGCTQSTPTVVGDPEQWLPQYLCGHCQRTEGDDVFSHLLEIPGFIEVPGPADHWNQSYGESQRYWPLGQRVNMSYALVVLESMVLNDTTPPAGMEHYAVKVLAAVYGEYRSPLLLRDNITLMMGCNDTRKPVDAAPLVGANQSYNPIAGYYYDPNHIEQGWVVFEAPANFTGGKLLVFYNHSYGVTGSWNL